MRLRIVMRSLKRALVFAEQIVLPSGVESGQPRNRFETAEVAARNEHWRDASLDEVDAGAGGNRRTALHGREHPPEHYDFSRSRFLHPRQHDFDIGV